MEKEGMDPVKTLDKEGAEVLNTTEKTNAEALKTMKKGTADAVVVNNIGSYDVECVTTALQAQERLYLSVKTSHAKYGSKVLQKTIDVLDELRKLKSDVEGSSVNVQRVAVDTEILQEKIRPIMLMHVPKSLTSEVKQIIFDLVQEAFNGTCKSLDFIGLMTNPWYSGCHVDRGLQAKHNSILVVYQYKPEQFLSPVAQHATEQNQVIDEGWFTALELGHVAHYLVKGNVRLVNALNMSDSEVMYQSKEWQKLQKCVQRSDTNVLKLRAYLEQTRGQAVGKVARKRKSGVMGLRNGATLYEFCESFNLLSHSETALEGGTSTSGGQTREFSQQAFTKLKQIYAHEEDEEGSQVTKEELLDLVMAWKTDLDTRIGNKFTNPKSVEQVISEELFSARTDCRPLEPLVFKGSSEEEGKLTSLMTRIGGEVGKMEPSNIIMIAQAGSFLYDLHTPQSDVDYIVIYADPAREVLGSCRKRSESFEKRGPHLSFEYGAYEARLLVEMLWKCSVVILELAFSDNLEYMSPLWKQLVANKYLFLTEKAILQYFGLIKNNMNMIENGKHKDAPRERKLFYQIFHKLHCLEYFLRGEIPAVRCSGAVKDFIMKIRRGPLTEELSRERLYKKAELEIKHVRRQLAERTHRLPENVDHLFLTEWMKKIRGWNGQT